MRSLSDDASSDACLGDGTDWDPGAGSLPYPSHPHRLAAMPARQLPDRPTRPEARLRRPTTGSCLVLLRIAEALNDGN
eukprot:5414232-Pleurochrysis_carterae.AAC.1